MHYGPGVYQFFHLLETIIYIFFVMSIIAYFQWGIIQKENPHYLGSSQATISRKITSTTLGSFSEIKPLCWKLPLTQDTIKFECRSGREITHIFDIGLINSTDDRCLITKDNQLLQDSLNDFEKKCNVKNREKLLNNGKVKECLNKLSCEISRDDLIES